MFLKSLELNGFKSFAQKTVLEFSKGITAIVGPNGSGKSNIIDAVRWILGEREAKNLRGGKAEDLIFGGTPKKPRAGTAKVELCFDNHSGFFPVDFKEVVAKRQMNRDGASQYFLNKSEARFKDVVDFFARSRLGTKGLIIINQGNSDLFVRATPEERRIMIEEILGLREYQLKKSEAERKLKNTFFNLEKVKAMIDEVLPRLRSLKRQTGKWSKRAEIENELKTVEDAYFGLKFRGIKEHQKDLTLAFNDLEKYLNAKQGELKSAEAELKKIESEYSQPEELKEIKKRKNELLESRFNFQKELSRFEAKLEMSDNSAEADFKTEELVVLVKNVRKKIGSADFSDFETAKKIMNEISAEIDNFFRFPNEKKNDELAVLVKAKEGLISKLSDIEKEIEKIGAKETRLTSGLETFNKRFKSAVELTESKREELRILENKKNNLAFEKEKLEIRRGDLTNQLSQIGREEEEFYSAETVVGQKEEIDPAEAERRMFKLRAEIAGIGEIDESLLKEAEEVEKHYIFLTGQSKDLEKAAEDLKNLITELNQKIHSEFSGSLKLINEAFNNFFRLMFGGGQARIKIKNQKLKIKNSGEAEDEEILISEKKDGEKEDSGEEKEESAGVEIELSLPRKRISRLEMLSGGEKSLVSIAALFALVSVSPPPFLVLDEIDAALDENNSKRFADLIKEFSKKTQFIVVTHNRTTMETADCLYGVTVGEDGTSKILSLKFESEI